MKKFKFRLQSVLNLKEREEDLIQKELIRLKQEKSKVEDRINDYKNEKIELQKKLEEEEEDRVDLELALRAREYIKYLNKMVEELLVELEYWEKEVSKCKDRLLEKLREKKSLVKLKDKKYEEYGEEYRAKEQELNDELVNNKYSRKSGSLNL